jgi:hypothetical protein
MADNFLPHGCLQFSVRLASFGAGRPFLEKAMDEESWEKYEYENFTLKELFPDITHQELHWMNKWLKWNLDRRGEKMLPQKTMLGDKYPSNVYPSHLIEIAMSYLGSLRATNGSRKEIQECFESSVEYPANKWGPHMPFGNGEWEDYPTRYCTELLNLQVGLK